MADSGRIRHDVASQGTMSINLLWEIGDEDGIDDAPNCVGRGAFHWYTQLMAHPAMCAIASNHIFGLDGRCLPGLAADSWDCVIVVLSDEMLDIARFFLDGAVRLNAVRVCPPYDQVFTTLMMSQLDRYRECLRFIEEHLIGPDNMLK